MPRLRELPLERRQQRLGLCGLRLLRYQVEPRHRAQVELAPHQVELLVLRVDDLARRIDLRAQRCLPDGSGHDVRRQREVSARELVVLVVDQRLQRFELAPVAAGDVECIRHIDRRVVQIENRRSGIGLAERDAGKFLACRAEVTVNARIEQRAGLRGKVFACDAQCRLRGGEIRTVGDCLSHQRVERIGMEQRPPLGRQILPRYEALRGARRARCGCGLSRQLRLGIAGRRRCVRLAEIRADYTAGKNRTCCPNEGCATDSIHFAAP